MEGSSKPISVRIMPISSFGSMAFPFPTRSADRLPTCVPPRAWERADIILGGMEAQYGNKTALLVDITSKSGTKPGFGSMQVFGGSNETVNPSFEYGGTVGEKFRYYALNSFITTNRGLEPPTLGYTNNHNQSEKNNTYLRGDYQHDNRNNFSWIYLNSVAKYQIPTIPNLAANTDVLTLLQAQDPTYTPVASQSVNQYQKENNQYSQLVWRHDVDAANFFNLGFYLRRGEADFHTPASTRWPMPTMSTVLKRPTRSERPIQEEDGWTIPGFPTASIS